MPDTDHDRLPKRILIAEDDPIISAAVEQVAQDRGYLCRAVGTRGEVEHAFEQFRPDVIALDLSFPDGDGVEILRYLGTVRCAAGIIILSGHDERVVATVQRLGQSHGLKMLPPLRKPFSLAALEEILSRVGRQYPTVTAAMIDQAVLNEEFRLFYQPKIDIRSDPPFQIKGVEALIRWQHPDRGLINPTDFLGIAENDGGVRPLTHWVLREAMQQAAQWRAQGLDIDMAINLSATLLSDLGLPDECASLARSCGVARENILFEITETGVMTNVTTVLDIASRFRVMGFGLSLDDFGTGFSSLLQLYRLPVNELKIDRSFVRDIAHSREAQTITRISVDLAHALGMRACAEGVESVEVLDLLHATGCDIAQGFLFSKPKPAEEILPMLKERVWQPDR